MLDNGWRTRIAVRIKPHRISRYELNSLTPIRILVPCSQYLCPDTLVCVSNPADCPCPDAEDVKCLIPDGRGKQQATVVCTRGAIDCKQVERLTSKL